MAQSFFVFNQPPDGDRPEVFVTLHNLGMLYASHLMITKTDIMSRIKNMCIYLVVLGALENILGN